MKTLQWIGRFITGVTISVMAWWITTNFYFLPIYFVAYPAEILFAILSLIFLILAMCLLEIVLNRRMKTTETPDISKPVKKLISRDFPVRGVRIEESSVFIAGIPMFRSIRTTYEPVKKPKSSDILRTKHKKN